MLGLHKREKTTEKEEETPEFHDEEEQEHILQELGASNAASNLLIQRGLLIVGALLSLIFLMFLYQLTARGKLLSDGPVLPLPFPSQPVTARVPWPMLWSVCSVVTIGFSVYTLMDACQVGLREILGGAPARRKLREVSIPLLGLTVATGATAPLVALGFGAHGIEVVFWCLPLVLLGLNLAAVHMMGQVEKDMDALEKARYTFKGA